MDSETTGDIVRSLLLVLAFAGLFAGLWPAIGGAAGVWAGAAESSSVRKPTGVVTGPWVTEISPSISWIHVEVSANHEVEVRIIALSQRRIEVSNDSGFAAADDLLAIGGGLKEGRQISLTGSHGGPVRYMIIVAVAASAQAQSVNETDLDYTLTWQVHKLDPMVFLMGLILFGMFFVTEYILSVKRDLKVLSKRLDRFAADGGLRAAPSALGMPMVAPSIMEAPLGEPAPAAVERGGFFGRRPRETAPAEDVAAPPPAPAAPRYAASAPPELYSPPPYSPPPYAPPPEPAPYTPPPPIARASARPSAPPPAPAPPPPAAPMEAAEPEPVSRVRCPQCKHIVPVYTAERPTPIKCPNCGKRGMLTK